jgi:hypothetical protein
MEISMFTYTEKDSQSFGVLIKMGSSTPASWLFLTTSSYVVPVATMRLSSSERAIQAFGGAALRASILGLFSVAGMIISVLI